MISHDQSSNIEKVISSIVVLGALVLTVSLIVILREILQNFIAPINLRGTDCSLNGERLILGETFGQYQACKVMLEIDAQALRTHRAQSILAARLFTQSISILAGITLLIMGSSFVFARIKGPNSGLGVEANSGGGGISKFILNSYFPGVILCGLGTIIIVSTVYISTNQKSITEDRPVFLDWPQGSYSVYSSYPHFYAKGNLRKEDKKELKAIRGKFKKLQESKNEK